MKKPFVIAGLLSGLIFACQQPEKVEETTAVAEVAKEMHELNGYPTKAAWGEHLVAIGGCNDCHSPKIMTEKGPMPDPKLLLSGHPANDPMTKLDRQLVEENGYGACNPHMTAWVGPWGMSFAANLTSDASGIGNWTEENFVRALRQGKYKGLEAARDLLPPMPIPATSQYTDEEISAIFAYLKTVPAVANIVPAPLPPVSAAKKKA